MKLIFKTKRVATDEIDSVATGNEVASHRAGLKITQDALAARMGITQAYLSMLENGTREWNQDLITRAQRAMRKQ